MKARRAVLGWLLFAMVCAQALGLLHRVAHLPAGHAAAWAHASPGAEQRQPAAQAANWTHALFAHADEAGCRLLDGLGHCGTPVHAPDLAPPLAPAAQSLLFADAGPVERRPSPFLARGPPLSR